MKTRFAFGKSGLEVSIPAAFRTVELGQRSASALPNEGEAIENALDHSIGGPGLIELARGKASAAICVCDITRPAPNAITLPPLLDRLHRAGIKRDAVTILIATGLHRAATAAEVVQILGSVVSAQYRIVSNDARAEGQHRFLGPTRRGTPVHIHEAFVAADLHVTLGFIEQHLMAGFSGGRKLIAPGVAAEETIKALHSPRFMRDPSASEGVIAGNPLHAELLEIAAMARHDYMLDVTLTRERRISGVFAGSPEAAHGAGIDYVERTALEQIEEPADLVITSAAGFPLDLTFYQTVKAITAARALVRPGGRILVLSECAEGMGSAEFAHRMRTLQSFTRFLDETETGPVEVDQWQLEKLALCGLANRLFFYVPGVAREELGLLGSSSYGSAGEALEAATADLPPDARVVLVPDGPYTFARTRMEHLEPVTDQRKEQPTR